MESELSQERIDQIRHEFYEAKRNHGSVIHRIAKIYFANSEYQNSMFENPIGKIMQWANSDFDSVEDRAPIEMVAKTSLMKVLLEMLVSDLIDFGFIDLNDRNKFIK